MASLRLRWLSYEVAFASVSDLDLRPADQGIGCQEFDPLAFARPLPSLRAAP
jgi:hypothetical protein